MDQQTLIEVPQQIRALAGTSVDQAEKAFAAFMEAAGKSVSLIPSPANDVPKQILSLTEQNIKASFDHARKLLATKDLQEFAKVQTEFLTSQMASAAEQFKKFGTTIAEKAKNGHA